MLWISIVDPLIPKDMFQDTQGMPETTDSTKPYIHSWALNNTDLNYRGPLIHKRFQSMYSWSSIFTGSAFVGSASWGWIMDYAYNLCFVASHKEHWLWDLSIFGKSVTGIGTSTPRILMDDWTMFLFFLLSTYIWESLSIN